MNLDEVNTLISNAINDSKISSEMYARIEDVGEPESRRWLAGVGGSIGGEIWNINPGKFTIKRPELKQPFIVVDGQVYINQSIIESATIKVK